MTQMKEAMQKQNADFQASASNFETSARETRDVEVAVAQAEAERIANAKLEAEASLLHSKVQSDLHLHKAKASSRNKVFHNA